MPKASVRAATIVNPRLLRSMRKANLRSWNITGMTTSQRRKEQFYSLRHRLWPRVSTPFGLGLRALTFMDLGNAESGKVPGRLHDRTNHLALPHGREARRG